MRFPDLKRLKMWKNSSCWTSKKTPSRYLTKAGALQFGCWNNQPRHHSLGFLHCQKFLVLIRFWSCNLFFTFWALITAVRCTKIGCSTYASDHRAQSGEAYARVHPLQIWRHGQQIRSDTPTANCRLARQETAEHDATAEARGRNHTPGGQFFFFSSIRENNIENTALSPVFENGRSRTTDEMWRSSL